MQAISATIRRFTNWWKAQYNRRSGLGKILFMLIAAVFVCCSCSVPYVVPNPLSAEDIAEVENEGLDEIDVPEEAVEIAEMQPRSEPSATAAPTERSVPTEEVTATVRPTRTRRPTATPRPATTPASFIMTTVDMNEANTAYLRTAIADLDAATEELEIFTSLIPPTITTDGQVEQLREQGQMVIEAFQKSSDLVPPDGLEPFHLRYTIAVNDCLAPVNELLDLLNGSGGSLSLNFGLCSNNALTLVSATELYFDRANESVPTSLPPTATQAPTLPPAPTATAAPSIVPPTAPPPTATTIPPTVAPPTAVPPTSLPPSPTAPAEPTAPGAVVISSINYDGGVPRVESDEFAVITNTGGTAINVGGWRLNAGDPGQDFGFPSFDLQPGQSCRVYTNQVNADSCGGASFNSGQALWNNDGDCGYLFDNSGAQVSQRCY